MRIVNRMGLHARPISEFVRLVARFQVSVRVAGPGGEADGSSMLDMMRLAGSKGSELCITTRGPEAAPALEALCRLVSDGFGEP